MKVFIYVEGVSDKFAMEALLRPLLDQKRLEGKNISFVAEGGKNQLLLKAPVKAADWVAAHWQHHAIILPDLYPKNMGITHNNLQELAAGLRPQVEQRLRLKKLPEADVAACLARFHVQVFKHDLEVLVLAAEPQLLAHLGCSRFPAAISWTKPVEYQNNVRPPKYVVEDLFQSCGLRYRTTDAALILGNCHYEVIADKCPESFKPLVELLKSL